MLFTVRYREPLPGVATAVLLLADARGPERIMLFGSHARGTATRPSDPDFWLI